FGDNLDYSAGTPRPTDCWLKLNSKLLRKLRMKYGMSHSVGNTLPVESKEKYFPPSKYEIIVAAEASSNFYHKDERLTSEVNICSQPTKMTLFSTLFLLHWGFPSPGNERYAR
ncbi:hypothetical protein NPIL_142261, partial [Nephila pilipes]